MKMQEYIIKSCNFKKNCILERCSIEISIRPMTDMDYDIAGNLLNLEDADSGLIEAFENRKNMYSV